MRRWFATARASTGPSSMRSVAAASSACASTGRCASSARRSRSPRASATRSRSWSTASSSRPGSSGASPTRWRWRSARAAASWSPRRASPGRPRCASSSTASATPAPCPGTPTPSSPHSSWLRDEPEGLVTDRPCPACEGARLRRETRFVRVGGRNIVEVSALSIAGAATFFRDLKLSPAETEIARPILKEVIARLGFLIEVGLDYLTLDRGAATLSGGEGQRIRLATQIGSRLVGVLYILDEPSIGLHPRDNARLLAILRELRDLGNSVIVAEHDRGTIVAADHVVDLGPGGGAGGGHVVATGPPAAIMANPASLTGRYLSGAEEIPVPPHRRRGTGWSVG